MKMEYIPEIADILETQYLNAGALEKATKAINSHFPMFGLESNRRTLVHNELVVVCVRGLSRLFNRDMTQDEVAFTHSRVKNFLEERGLG